MNLFVSLGTIHPSPCPDCGGRLLLVEINGRFRYECERGITMCYGNAAANEKGEPVGTAIDRLGRKKRVELHNLIDPWWRETGVPLWNQAIIRTMIYNYMCLACNIEDFHVGILGHAELDHAIEVATTTLPKYTKSIGLERRQNAENIQYSKRSNLRPG